MAVSTSHAKWVMRPKPNPAARLRAFCFPYAGVGASAFRTWTTDFAADVELCLVQLPGREGRFTEPAVPSVKALADSVATVLSSFGAQPYVFFGHSLGALISFEVARELRRRGQTAPLHMFVSAHRAPHLPNPHPPLRHLEDKEFVDAIAREYGGIPQALFDNPELLELMLPCLRADFTAFETYLHVTEAPLGCPMTVFGGRQDPRVGESELRGWREQTSGAFRLQMFEGTHFFLQTAREALLAAIRRELEPAMATALQ